MNEKDQKLKKLKNALAEFEFRKIREYSNLVKKYIGVTYEVRPHPIIKSELEEYSINKDKPISEFAEYWGVIEIGINGYGIDWKAKYEPTKNAAYLRLKESLDYLVFGVKKV